MRDFTKQISKRFSILVVALILGGAITGCTSAVDNKTASNNTVTIGEQNKSFDGDKKQPENKSSENNPAAESEQTKLVLVYDGRENNAKLSESKVVEADQNFIEKEVRAKETFIKKITNKADCDEKDTFSVNDVVEDSFTKPDTKQKAYLYKLCDNGMASDAMGIGGIIIIENGNVAAHYVYTDTLASEILSLPDVDKNGLSEIGLIVESGGQGLRTSQINILEYKAGNLLVYIGWTETGSVSFNSDTSNETAYKISIEPSANPAFFRETYQKKDGAKDWSLTKKSEKFTLYPEQKAATAYIKID